MRHLRTGRAHSVTAPGIPASCAICGTVQLPGARMMELLCALVEEGTPGEQMERPGLHGAMPG